MSAYAGPDERDTRLSTQIGSFPSHAMARDRNWFPEGQCQTVCKLRSYRKQARQEKIGHDHVRKPSEKASVACVASNKFFRAPQTQQTRLLFHVCFPFKVSWKMLVIP